jgi:hypothetical protein
MTKFFISILSAGALAAVLALPTAAEAACTINASKSNSTQFKDSVTGQDCTPTAAEKAAMTGNKSNSSEKPAKPKSQPASANPPAPVKDRNSY